MDGPRRFLSKAGAAKYGIPVWKCLGGDPDRYYFIAVLGPHEQEAMNPNKSQTFPPEQTPN